MHKQACKANFTFWPWNKMTLNMGGHNESRHRQRPPTHAFLRIPMPIYMHAHPPTPPLPT